MEWIKYTFILFGILVLSYILLVFNEGYEWIDFTGSGREEFDNWCESLQGKEASVENLKSLDGWCWRNGREMIKCDQETISRLEDGTDPFVNIRDENHLEHTKFCNVDIDENGNFKTASGYENG